MLVTFLSLRANYLNALFFFFGLPLFIKDYNVTSYGGTKSFVISTVSFMGGRNPFLGIAYVVVGVLCVVLGLLFTARHLYKPRRLGDHTYLSWNQNGASSAAMANAAASTATTTGASTRY